MNARGFLLVEALLAMLVLTLAASASFQSILQASAAAKRSEALSAGILKTEEELFDLESGIRPDLVVYGGKENLAGDYRMDFNVEEEAEGYSDAVFRLLKGDSEILTKEGIFAEAKEF